MATSTVYIVGGGPGACATAIALKKHTHRLGLNLSIILIVDRDKNQPAVGETIPPAATQYLNDLDLSHLLEKQHLECPGSISIWGDEVPGHNDFLFTPVGRAYHLNRSYFNEQLLQACHTEDIHIIKNSKVCNVKKLNEGFFLEIQSDNGGKKIDGSFIVDATGKSSLVARRLGVARNVYDSVISLCAFFTIPENNRIPAHTLVCTSEVGWWYGARLPGNKAIISLCTDSQTLKQKLLYKPKIWFEYLKKSQWFYSTYQKQCLTSFSFPENLHAYAAPSSILSNCVGEGWLAVGDAASSYDSISSAGITKALAHGKLAGESIAKALATQSTKALKEYQHQVFYDFNHYLRLHQQLYSIEKRYLNSDFWKNRIRIFPKP